METDVTQVSSPEPNANVEETVVQSEQVSQTAAEVPQNLPLPTEGNQVVAEEVDEMGVPFKNRYMESQRKLDKTSSELGELKSIVQQLATTQQAQQQEPKYTIAELETYKAQNPDLAPQDKAWIESEKARLLKEEIAETIRSEYKQKEEAQKNEYLKQQSLNTIAQQFPDAFAKDQTGRVTGWNAQSPIVQRMSQYLSDPAIANRPDGALLAARLAHGELASAGLIQAKSQLNNTQSQTAELNRRMAIEGGTGPAVQSGSPVVNAINNLRETGSRTDARNALKGILFSGNKEK